MTRRGGRPGPVARPALRRRRRANSGLLSILALLLLIGLFLARRLAPHPVHLNATASSPGDASSVGPADERITPADRQSLDRIIRDRAHH